MKQTAELLHRSKVYAIAFLWVIHISGLIGIYLGHLQWFIVKTPLNLLYMALICILYLPIRQPKAWFLFGISFLTGMLAEWIGVHTGLLFGDYYYGNNLGPTLDGIPYLIGINWAILVICSVTLSRKRGGILLASAIGAAIMVILDVTIEPLAPKLDFWHWISETAPLFNYICWFLVAYPLNLLGQFLFKEGDTTVAVHILLAQFIFFTVLNAII